MTARRVLLPRAFKAAQAAEYLAMSETKFRELVSEGRIAQPKDADGLVTWDVKDLDAYYDALPRRGSAANDDWNGAVA